MIKISKHVHSRHHLSLWTNTLYGHSAWSSKSFHNVVVVQSFSLYLISFLAISTEVFFTRLLNLASWQLRQIDTVMHQKKKRISLNHVSRIRLTEFNIFYNNASLRNNVTKSLIAMLIRIIHIYSLCLNTVCHEKHVIWTYLTFLNTFHVFSMAL